MSDTTAPVPMPSDMVFSAGIDHPELWLWDSWTLQEGPQALHLYCLALSRTRPDAGAITPRERNNFPFHVRRFLSHDQGQSWRDCGAVLRSGSVGDGADARNVWSGSVLRLDRECIAFGFTGVRDCGAGRDFLQTICIATGPEPGDARGSPAAALSCPLRDYDSITAKGYFLGARDTLGSNAGEDGGPIMAWRDPFLFTTDDGELHALWSAKLSPKRPAIAHARLKRDGNQIRLAALEPPIDLPDASLMTQAEVPKIYRDPASGDFLLLVSACDRQYEGQPDSQLTHIHRLYRSRHIAGPWQPFRASGSALSGLDGLFGASLLSHDTASGRLRVLGPYTENAGPNRQLRFGEVRDIAL